MYTLGKFRENMREAFNKAESGEKVVVTRYGKSYLLHLEGVIPHNKLSTDDVSSNVRPMIVKKARQSGISKGMVTKLAEDLAETHREPRAENIKVNDDGSVSPKDVWKPSSFETGTETLQKKMEAKCCKGNCEHWKYGLGGWKNSLSGRVR